MPGNKFIVQGTGTDGLNNYDSNAFEKPVGNEDKSPKCFNMPDLYGGSLSSVLEGLVTNRTKKEIEDVVNLLDNNEELNDFFDSLYGRYIYSKESNIKNDKKMILLNYVMGVLSMDDILELINNEIPFNFLIYYTPTSTSSESVSEEDLTFLKGLKNLGIDGHSQYLCFHRYKNKKLTLSDCRKIKQEYPDEKDFENYMQDEKNFN